MTARADAPFVSVAPPRPLPATSKTLSVLDFAHCSKIGANSASSRSASARPSDTIPHFSWLKTSASFLAEASSRSLADRSRVLSFGPILMHESNNGVNASSLHRLPAASNSPISGNFGSTRANASPNTSPKERCDRSRAVESGLANASALVEGGVSRIRMHSGGNCKRASSARKSCLGEFNGASKPGSLSLSESSSASKGTGPFTVISSVVLT
mmetsp:Transcript_20025/g.59685  ORF Transcript_20025/g.59685 Transcript_20025/m.59685 type:complete len:213 (+) Transcript_20025:2943-3581(+)